MAKRRNRRTGAQGRREERKAEHSNAVQIKRDLEARAAWSGEAQALVDEADTGLVNYPELSYAECGIEMWGDHDTDTDDDTLGDHDTDTDDDTLGDHDTDTDDEMWGDHDTDVSHTDLVYTGELTMALDGYEFSDEFGDFMHIETEKNRNYALRH